MRGASCLFRVLRHLRCANGLSRRRTNFVCVNDDMKLAPPVVVKALRDFYRSYFPLPSSFELPEGTVCLWTGYLSWHGTRWVLRVLC